VQTLEGFVAEMEQEGGWQELDEKREWRKGPWHGAYTTLTLRVFKKPEEHPRSGRDEGRKSLCV
jgi:hypothetical protein